MTVRYRTKSMFTDHEYSLMEGSMSIDVWISFIAAALILCFSPGPTAFLVMGQALGEHGKNLFYPWWWARYLGMSLR